MTVFTQRWVFLLVSDHHIQHGPSFPNPIDFLVDAATGVLSFRDADGTLNKEHMDLPPDVANGLPPNLLLNIAISAPETTITYVAPAKKLAWSISRSSRPAACGSESPVWRKATDFTLHVKLGGISGVIAPLIGKEPADFHIWLMSGVPPVFVREEGPLYEGGPIWRIEMISPVF